jgi:hypothetical protein
VAEPAQPDTPGRATELAGADPVALVAGPVGDRSALAELVTVADRARLAAERTGSDRPAELAAWLADRGYPADSTEAIRSALRRNPVEPAEPADLGQSDIPAESAELERPRLPRSAAPRLMSTARRTAEYATQQAASGQ